MKNHTDPIPTEAQLQWMLKKQEQLNSLIHKDWREQQFNWPLAAAMEAAEAIDHTPWKWWKKGTLNLEQLRLELVDIWHFVLSEHLQKPLTLSESAFNLWHVLHGASNNYADNTTQGNESTLITAAFCRLASDGFAGFITHKDLMAAQYHLEFNGQQVFMHYLSKWVLNNHRQANGYQDGCYQKHWLLPEREGFGTDLLEDNQVLTLLVNRCRFKLNQDPDEIAGELKTYLQQLYDIRVNEVED